MIIKQLTKFITSKNKSDKSVIQTMINEEQIFDILDGLASPEIIHQHKNLLKTSPEYKAYFKEMEALHLDLSKMSSEQPSIQFTNKLLQNLGVATAPKKISWTTKLIYVFAGIVCCLIGFLAFNMTTTTPIDDPFVTKLVNLSTNFFNGIFIRILLIINALMLLVVIDKKVLKPFFERKRMAF